jgi:hypothetical protein
LPIPAGLPIPGAGGATTGAPAAERYWFLDGIFTKDCN